MFNPIGVLMNGGLDVLQSYNSSTHADDIKWDIQATSVWCSVTIYPGVFSESSFSPGFFFTLGNGGTYAAGITMQIFPFGIGMYAPH